MRDVWFPFLLCTLNLVGQQAGGMKIIQGFQVEIFSEVYSNPTLRASHSGSSNSRFYYLSSVFLGVVRLVAALLTAKYIKNFGLVHSHQCGNTNIFYHQAPNNLPDICDYDGDSDDCVRSHAGAQYWPHIQICTPGHHLYAHILCTDWTRKFPKPYLLRNFPKPFSVKL